MHINLKTIKRKVQTGGVTESPTSGKGYVLKSGSASLELYGWTNRFLRSYRVCPLQQNGILYLGRVIPYRDLQEM